MVPPPAPGLKSVLGAAVEIQAFLRARGERYCLIGGLALQRWGEPRLTRDVDLTLFCSFGAEATTADMLLAEFSPRVEDARNFALQRRVLLLRSRKGIGIDVAFGGIPYEARCIERSSDWGLEEGVVLHTCSAEDLVVLKAFAGRERDWLDVHSVILRQGEALDWKLIVEELRPLLELKGAPDALERLAGLRQER